MAVGRCDTVVDIEGVEVRGTVAVGGSVSDMVWRAVVVGGRVGVEVIGSDTVGGTDLLTVY